MSDFSNWIWYISTNIYNVFDALDSVNFWDSGVSILDALLSVLYIEITWWFLERLLKMDSEEDDDEGDSTPTAGTMSSGEGDY